MHKDESSTSTAWIVVEVYDVGNTWFALASYNKMLMGLSKSSITVP